MSLFLRLTSPCLQFSSSAIPLIVLRKQEIMIGSSPEYIVHLDYTHTAHKTIIIANKIFYTHIGILSKYFSSFTDCKGRTL